jgi:hypothetical protein
MSTRSPRSCTPTPNSQVPLATHLILDMSHANPAASHEGLAMHAHQERGTKQSRLTWAPTLKTAEVIERHDGPRTVSKSRRLAIAMGGGPITILGDRKNSNHIPMDSHPDDVNSHPERGLPSIGSRSVAWNTMGGGRDALRWRANPVKW